MTHLRSFARIAPLVFDPPREDYPPALRRELEKLELRKAQTAEHLAGYAAAELRG